MILKTLNIRKRRKFLKNLLQTLEYWCCSIFVSLVTQVLLNHPNYLCYLDLCFWFPCFKYGIIFLHVGSSARQCRENSWGMFSLLEIFLVILEDWNSFVVWYRFYGGWDSLSPKMKSMWLLYFDWGQITQCAGVFVWCSLLCLSVSHPARVSRWAAQDG